MLNYKVAMFREEENMPYYKWMKWPPGVQIDSLTGAILGRPTMKNAAGGYDNYTTHVLVFLIAGISTRWKQTIAYEYTGKFFSAERTMNSMRGLLCSYALKQRKFY